MLQEFNPSLLDASSKTNDRASREVSPNRGASVKDIEATGPEQEALGVWRTREGIDPENQIKIVKVAHMRYRHPDLEEITTFMRGTMEANVLHLQQLLLQEKMNWLIHGRLWHDHSEEGR